jgi:large subunit ribosomal protein L3
MKFLLGTKQNMTQIFTENGEVVPVTILSTGPNTVTQIKSTEKDGYTSVQVAYGEKKPKNIKKPQKGHFKDLGNFRHVKEYRITGDASVKVGDKIDMSGFKTGDLVEVSAISKGKGFQGVVKRHGFPRSETLRTRTRFHLWWNPKRWSRAKRYAHGRPHGF